jgi:hypothetical protein
MAQRRDGPDEATAGLRGYVFSADRTFEDVVTGSVTGTLRCPTTAPT